MLAGRQKGHIETSRDLRSSHHPCPLTFQCTAKPMGKKQVFYGRNGMIVDYDRRVLKQPKYSCGKVSTKAKHALSSPKESHL